MGKRQRIETILLGETSSAVCVDVGEPSNSRDLAAAQLGDNTEDIPKRVRGKTVLPHVDNIPPNRKIAVESNRWNQPVGNAAVLASYIGKTLRAECPPYLDWRKVPTEKKNSLCITVKEKFHFSKCTDKYSDKWVKLELCKALNTYRYALKKTYFRKVRGKSWNLENRPSNVEIEHWRPLVDYWMSEEGKDAEERGKKSRACQVFSHKSGRRSYAVVEEKLNNEAGVEVGKIRVLEVTHTDGSGTIQDPRVFEILDKAKDMKRLRGCVTYEEEVEILMEVMGRKHKRRVLGFGLGPTPATVFSHKASAPSATHTDEEFHNLQIELSDHKVLLGEQQRRLDEQEKKNEEQEKKNKMLEDKLNSLYQHIRAN